MKNLSLATKEVMSIPSSLQESKASRNMSLRDSQTQAIRMIVAGISAMPRSLYRHSRPRPASQVEIRGGNLALLRFPSLVASLTSHSVTAIYATQSDVAATTNVFEP